MDELFIFYGVISLIIGLSIGSFLNVVALRSLWGEEFVKSGSRCPKCRNNLHWYNNIPLLSFIFQGGKCQFCKCKISFQYPLVEAITGALFVLTYFLFGISIKSLLIVIMLSLFIVIVITDIKEQVIFDWHSYPIIVLGLIYSYFYGSIVESLIGIAVGFIIFEILAAMGYLFAKSRAFGFGDTILAMGLGAIFGWKTLLIVIFLSILLQAVFVIPILIYKAFKVKGYKLCAAMILTLIALVILYKFNYFPHMIAPLLVVFWGLIVMIKDMREKPIEDFYAPAFGPAMLIAGTFGLFASNLWAVELWTINLFLF